MSCCLPRPSNMLPDAETEDQKLARIEQEEEYRMCQIGEQELAFDHDLEKDENSEWLRSSGWARWFKHKPLPVLIAAAAIPIHNCPSDFILGQWHSITCVSPASVEKTLQVISSRNQRAIERCLETLEHTPRVFRCWLRSWGPSFSPYPFERPSAPTIRRYRRIWTSSLCYFFRIWHLSKRLKESTFDLCGLEFTPPQSAALNDVWMQFSQLSSKTETCMPVEEIPIICLEALFQLTIVF